MGGDDVVPEPAQTLRVDDVESPANHRCGRQHERQDGCQGVSPPRRDVVIGQTRGVRFLERVGEYVNFVVPLEPCSQLGDIATLAYMPVVVVDHEGDFQAAVGGDHGGSNRVATVWRRANRSS